MNIKKENRYFFLELSQFLWNHGSFFSGDSNMFKLGTEIISEGKRIGLILTSGKDVELLRKNTGNVLLIALLIPDNLTGVNSHQSIVYIGNGYQARFQLISPEITKGERSVIMRVEK